MNSSLLSSSLTPGDGAVYIGDVQLQPTEHGLAFEKAIFFEPYTRL